MDELETQDQAQEINEQTPNSGFDVDLIRKYPRSNRRLVISVAAYGISGENKADKNQSQSIYISPYGIEFRSNENFPEGTLLKIHVSLPNYWTRKQKFVEYGRIDEPEQFKILAKVLKTEDMGKRGKKKMVLAQTVIIDEVDEKVLKTYLQEG